MSSKELSVESLRKLPNGARHRRGPGLRVIAWSTFVILVVAVPVMAVEEEWHGKPMIDQGNHLWLVAAFLVAGAFLAGGALAGYRRPAAAARYALAGAATAIAVLLGAAVGRRLWIAHEGLSVAVARLWFLGILVAGSVSAAGSQIGRRLAAGSD